MRNYSLDTKTSGAYRAVANAAPETRAERSERLALQNHAFRNAQIARNAKPRLVRGNEPPAVVLSMADFLAAAQTPAVDIVDVTLATTAVLSFDKAAIVSASL